LGGAKDFCPNLLKLTRKICVSKMLKTFFGSHTKKVFMCIMKKKMSNSDVFRQSVSFITQWEQRCRNIRAQILRDFFPYFQRFCPDFWRIKTFGGALVFPLHPRLLHHCLKWTRDQVSRLHPTNSLKISMQYSCQKIPKLSNNAYTSNACYNLKFFYAH